MCVKDKEEGTRIQTRRSNAIIYRRGKEENSKDLHSLAEHLILTPPTHDTCFFLFFFRGGCFWAPQTRAPSLSQSVDGILSDLLSFNIRSHKYYTDDVFIPLETIGGVSYHLDRVCEVFKKDWNNKNEQTRWWWWKWAPWPVIHL